MQGSVAILTIGTEVSTGEILNRNAQWLADQLTQLRWDVTCHLTVADEEKLMRSALDFSRVHAQVILITGGLGPTRDDFTRDVVARWAGDLPLDFHEASWKRIVDRLTARGVEVATSNRQQCFFPRGAEIYPNSRGTADGFSIYVGSTWVICLPGPPAEIEAIWKDALKGAFTALLPSERVRRLLVWQTIGVSESKLGEMVEAALEGSDYLTGYRPHIPYVDIKIWVPFHLDAATDPYLQRLDALLMPCTVARNGEDLATTFLDLSEAQQRIWWIDDGVTLGKLADRLGDPCARAAQKRVVYAWIYSRLGDDDDPWDIQKYRGSKASPNHVATLRANDQGGRVEITSIDHSKHHQTFIFTYPRKKEGRGDFRFRAFACEMVLVKLIQWMKENPQK